MVNNPPCRLLSTLWISNTIGPATRGGQISKKAEAAPSASGCAPRKPARLVTKIRKGKIAVSPDKAIWLAMA